LNRRDAPRLKLRGGEERKEKTEDIIKIILFR